MTSILDRSFKYYPASDTDLRRTFRRVRREMREPQSPQPAETPARESAQVAVLPMNTPRRVRLSA